MKDNENIKKEIEIEVKKYENDKTSPKDYFTSMQEMSAWLSKREEQ